MALTRITKGVIKPNENYDTHNINSTGIVTAIGLDVNGNGDISGNLNVGGVLTYEDVTSIDSVGIITAQKDIHVGAGVSVVGIVTASTFKGDGDFVDIDVDGHTNLDNVSIAGITTVALNQELVFGSNADSQLTGRIKQLSGSSPSMQITSKYPRINALDFRIHNINDNNHYAYFWSSEVALFHQGNKKFSTTGGGIDVTGNTVADGLVIDGNSDLNGDLDVDGHTNLDNVSIAGVTTVTGDLDVDGHTNLDNVSIAGVTTFASNIVGTNATFSGNINASGSGSISGFDAITIEAATPALNFTETDANPDYRIIVLGGQFRIQDVTNGYANRFIINTDGTTSIEKNLNCLSDLDVDGHTNLDNVSVAGVSTFSDTVNGTNLILSHATPTIQLNDSNNNPDYVLQNNNGVFRIRDNTNSADRLTINSSGYVNIGVTDNTPLAVKGISGALSVDSRANISLLTGATDGASATGTGILFFNHSGAGQFFGGSVQVIKENSGNGNTDSLMRFATRANGGNVTERMRITSGGTLGINLLSPDTSFRLDCSGAAQFTTSTTNQQNDFLTGQLTVRNSQSAQGAFIDFRADSNNGTQGVIAKIGGFNTYNGSGYDGLLTFSTRQNSNNTMVERLRITSNGNLLVNQNTEFGSAVKLSVRGASSVISDGGQIFDITTTAAASGGTRLAFGVNEDSYAWIRSYESGVGSRDLIFAGVAEYGRFDSSGRLLLGSNFSSNVNTFKYSIKESGTVNAAILFLDTDNMRGGICGATRGNNELITGTGNMDFVVGSLYSDTHIIRGVSGNTSGAIGMTIEGATGHIGINNTNPTLEMEMSFTSGTTQPTSGTTPKGIGLSFGNTDGHNGGIWFSGDVGGDQGIAGISGTRTSNYDVDLRFYTNNSNSARAFSERMRITPAGNVGINENQPTSQLVVRATTDDNPAIRMYRQSTGGDVAALIWSTAAGNQSMINYRGGGGNEGLQFYIGGSSSSAERVRFQASNFREIIFPGQNNDTYAHRVYRTTVSANANSYTKFATVTGPSYATHIKLSSTATIGNVVTSADFEIKVGHSQDIMIISKTLAYTNTDIKVVSDGNQSYDLYIKRNGGYNTSSNSTFKIAITPFLEDQVTFNSTVNYSSVTHTHTTSYGAMKITATGGPDGNIIAQGSITGNSKNFSIPHPLSSLTSTKKLVHASIESPQLDLIYRGKVNLVDGTATINIDTVSGMSDGTFVLLNGNVQCFTTNETGWTNIKGSVSGNVLTIIAQDNSCTDTISWMVIGERQDDAAKSSYTTDNSGNLIVEPSIIENPDTSHLHKSYPTEETP